MGRPRKLEPSVLVALVDGYYEEKAAGNAAKIRFSSLEAYAEEKGYTVKSYDFSRCREAVVRIEELKNSEEMRREETLAAAYKSLDVEGLLKQCTTVEALKETLIRMDGYWKRTYMEASALITRDRAFMQEKGKLDGKIRSLKEENARLQENGKEMLKENTALKRENVYLRRMLRTYLYPGIVNQILKESGLPVEGENAVKPEKFGELIEGKKPDAFRGRQKTPAPVLSWQERLQKELERQVSQDGNP